MKIECESCAVQHELDPPAWVISSGRAFRYRCSSCGHSQSVQPVIEEPEPAEASAPDSGDAADPQQSELEEPAEQDEPPAEAEAHAEQDEPPEQDEAVAEPEAAAEPEAPAEPEALAEPEAPAEPELAAESEASADTVAAPASDPEPDASVAASTSPTPSVTRHEGPSVDDVADAIGEPEPSEDTAGSVFLKQYGQIYMVQDWETLRRWIQERRVDKHDLVSEGGVRWEPISSRPDLAQYLEDEVPAVPEAPAAPPTLAQPPQPQPTPFPFGGEMPFVKPGQMTATPGMWHDSDTEGIPTGLPPLPTDGGEPTYTPPFPLDGTASGEFMAPPALLDDDEHNLPVAADDTGFTESPPPVPAEGPRRSNPQPEGQQPLQARHSGSEWDALIVSGATPDADIAYASSDTQPGAKPRDVSPTRITETVEASGGIDHSLTDSADAAPLVVPPPSMERAPPAPTMPPPQPREQEGLSTGAMLGLFAMVVILAFVGVYFGFVKPQTSAPTPNIDPTPAVAPAPAPTPTPTPPTAPEPDPAPDVTTPDAPPAAADATPEVPTEPAPDMPTSPAPDVPTDPAPDAPTDPAPDAPTDPAPDAPTDPAPDAPTEPTPAPTPDPPPAEPTPAPAPTPSAPSGGSSIRTLVDRGWNNADTDPQAAVAAFRQALTKQPGHHEANYGLGYALLQAGEPQTAQIHLCQARGSPDVDIQREVSGLLDNHNLSCE